MDNEHLSLEDVTKLVIVTFLATLFFTRFIIMNAYVPSGSMKPTINEGDRLIVDRIYYKIDGIERADIIVFDPPTEVLNDKSNRNIDFYVKRVIGLPGDTVKAEDGKVIVNGEELKEDYLMGETTEDFDEFTVPENEYFVLGDNRSNSYDSRYWSYSFVRYSDIHGIALLRYNRDFKIF